MIGDNVIIGARLVVKGNIPSNTVWAGVPAKQIYTLDEYYHKLKKQEENAIIYRKKVIEKKQKTRQFKDYGWFMIYFMERTKENYNLYFKELEFNGIKDSDIIKNYFFSTKPIYNGFDEMIKMMEKSKEI